MLYNSSVNYPLLKWPAPWRMLGFILIMLALHLVSGCSSKSVLQVYENPEFGISLEKPRNWNLDFYERNGSITLEAGHGAWNDGSARIEVYGYACGPHTFDMPDPSEELAASMDRIRTLYDLETVSMVEGLTKSKIQGQEVAKITVAIPTIALPEDSARNQMGVRGADIVQIVDIFAIRDSNDNSVAVYLYRGNSAELNATAQGIIDSIILICSAE